VTKQAQVQNNIQLIDEEQVIEYLKEHTDFFIGHSDLLAEIEIPHESGSAVSLIERQLSVLRDKNKKLDHRLRDLMAAAHDNQRLNESLQQLTINLFMAESLDDVIATVIEELKGKLETDFVTIHFITGDAKKSEQQADRYLNTADSRLQLFSKLLEDKRIQCGRLSKEQIELLFGDEAEKIGSGAVVPLADANVFGLMGIGGRDEQRYHPGMGTEYLQKLAELVSAAIKRYLD